MTRAQGLRRRLSATCSRYCSSVSRSGAYSGLVTAPTSSATRGPNSAASAASAPAWLPAGAGQVGGVIFHRIVQEGGDHRVGVVHAVMGHDPDRHPEQVVEVGLPIPAVGGVQPRREVQGLIQAALILLGLLDLGREPGSEPLLFAIGRGDRVQRHRRHEPPLASIHALQLAHHVLTRSGRTGGACGAGSGSNGRRMANRVMPGRLVTVMQPPCAATTASTMARPRPVLLPAALTSGRDRCRRG